MTLFKMRWAGLAFGLFLSIEGRSTESVVAQCKAVVSQLKSTTQAQKGNLTAITDSLGDCVEFKKAQLKLNPDIEQFQDISIDLTVGPRDGTSFVPVQPNQAGFAYEWGQLRRFTGESINKAMIRLYDHLAVDGSAPVTVIGGNSGMLLRYSSSTLPKNVDTQYEVSDDELESINMFSEKTGSKITLGLPMLSTDPRYASEFVTEGILNNIDPKNIHSFEIGNEPDHWRLAKKCFRIKSDFNYTDYLEEFVATEELILKNWPKNINKIPFQGPAIAGCNTFASKKCWVQYLGDFAAKTSDNTKYISWHRYGNSGCSKKTTIRTLLNDPIADDERKGYGWLSDLNEDLPNGKELIWSEGNAFSCGGNKCMSKTYAATLWGLDTLMEVTSRGVTRSHIHADSGHCYAPFNINDDDTVDVFPVYYALLQFSELVRGDKPVLYSPPVSPNHATIKVWSVEEENGNQKVLVIHKDPDQASPLKVTIKAGMGYTASAKLTRLLPRGNIFSEKVSIAGQSFNEYGELTRKKKEEEVIAVDGTYTFSVPPTTVAILYLTKTDRTYHTMPKNIHANVISATTTADNSLYTLDHEKETEEIDTATFATTTATGDYATMTEQMVAATTTADDSLTNLDHEKEMEKIDTATFATTTVIEDHATMTEQMEAATTTAADSLTKLEHEKETEKIDTVAFATTTTIGDHATMTEQMEAATTTADDSLTKLDHEKETEKIDTATFATTTTIGDHATMTEQMEAATTTADDSLTKLDHEKETEVVDTATGDYATMTEQSVAATTTAADSLTKLGHEKETEEIDTTTFATSTATGDHATMTEQMEAVTTTTDDSLTKLDHEKETGEIDTATFTITTAIGSHATMTEQMEAATATADDSLTKLDHEKETEEVDTATFTTSTATGDYATMSEQMEAATTTADDSFTKSDHEKETEEIDTATFATTTAIGDYATMTEQMEAATTTADDSLTKLDHEKETEKIDTATFVTTTAIGDYATMTEQMEAVTTTADDSLTKLDQEKETEEIDTATFATTTATGDYATMTKQIEEVIIPVTTAAR